MSERLTPQQIEHARAVVDDWIDPRRKQLAGLCASLVAARSANPPGRTVEAAEIIERFLSEHGLTCEQPAAVPDKPNIVSGIDGDGGGRHLILNGHLDTIGPGDEDQWSVPVHEMTERDGRLFGLGMGNMKGGVAALTFAYALLSHHRDLWHGRISYTAVADETVFGPDGAGWLLDQRRDLLGDAVICGEGPGAMNLAIAEKGVLWVRLTATAPAAQGMLSQQGSSAITRLATAISALDALNAHTVEPPADLVSVGAHAGEHGLRLSVNTGTVAGGTFVSQSASQATAELDFRIPPGMTIDDVDGHLDKLVQEVPGIAYQHIKGWDPNWTRPDTDIVVAVESAAGAVRAEPPKHVVRLPASDASRWRARGIPAVCFGPQPLLASGVDDYAELGDVVDCAKIYAIAAMAYLRP